MSQSFDLYSNHFRLTDRPFSLVPDPEYMYWSPCHKRAYTMLEYGLMTHAPITLITGDIGAGKTTLVHHLLRQIPDDVTVGYIANAHAGRGELLRWVLMALDQETPAGETYVDLFGRFQNYLIDEYARARRVVLIFDEAQNLDREALEELRMFTNINANKDELLQLVLVGQPELRALVRRPDLTQFAQRVAASFHLTAMDETMVREYIHHRLSVAGANREIFTPEAVALVFHSTRGIPRLVNQLADFSMVYAASANLHEVGKSTVLEVLRDDIFFSGFLLLENRIS